MLIEDRRKRLLDAVNSRGSLSVSEAERTLAVSRMTVHRDLDVLAAQGLVRKVHGGVVALSQRGTDLFDPRAQPFEDRLSQSRDAKKAIARHVFKLIAKANTLLLDSSTTVFYLHELLGDETEKRETYVVTGSLPLFTELARKRNGLRAALHGGEPHVRTGSLVGPLAVNSLSESRFDFVVMSCLGVLTDEGAIFVSSSEEVPLKQAYREHSRRAILAVDSAKFGQSSAHKLGDLSSFDHVVTEKGALTHEEFSAQAKKAGRKLK